MVKEVFLTGSHVTNLLAGLAQSLHCTFSRTPLCLLDVPANLSGLLHFLLPLPELDAYGESVRLVPKPVDASCARSADTTRARKI